MKCNIDAGFNINGETTNRGWCVRNNFGRFFYANITWDIILHSVLEAEVLSLKEAIYGAIAMQLKNVIFKSDSQKMIQAIWSNSSGFFEFSLII